MRADNWTVCPKCTQTYTNKVEAARTALNEAYGKVSIKAYNVLIEKLAEAKKVDESEPQTFREDYSQGVENGEYYSFYKGRCTVCNFEFVHKHTQKLDV